VASDFYHKYPEYIAKMKELGIKHFRMSIAWPRIIPDGTGEVNAEGVMFYNDVFDALEEAGIEPYITLYHWDIPNVRPFPFLA
jgi:beta-glucosidase